jgi:hypothetical protein
MAQVRGHYRNGRYVRPHYRRTTGAAARTAPQSRVQAQSPIGRTTQVRGHYRNGTYVRPHHRRVSDAAVAAVGGGGLLLFVLLLLAVLSGGGSASTGTPEKFPTTPASQTVDLHR